MKSQVINIDANLKQLIQQCGIQNHRFLLAILGSNAAEQVYVIKHLLSKQQPESSCLWCHRNSSEWMQNKQKTLKKIKRKLKKGEPLDGFEIKDISLAAGDVTFCAYDETLHILGNTYNLCVLQDIECLTPNIMCHVMETVKGGGAIVLLLPQLNSFEELCGLHMIVHEKYKSTSNPNIDSLFMKRFVQSFSWCNTSMILNDKLEICGESNLPKLISNPQPYEDLSLQEILNNAGNSQKPLDQLLPICCTIDQANVLSKLVEVLASPSSTKIVSITASRGRGKSATMGLGASAAIHFGIGNIFVVSPSPHNLKSFFDFLLKGFDALNYEENTHYEIMQSSNKDFGGAIISVTVFKNHRQTVQYLEPSDFKKLSQAQLVIIDEAAAIPLPQVKALFGPYNIFMSSTISGYEGTGRSLSLKLLTELRKQSVCSASDIKESVDKNSLQRSTPRSCLSELTMDSSIRYSPKDPVERWLYKLLCLEATSFSFAMVTCPVSSSCELYYVNKKSLFKGVRQSEQLLKQIMSLLVASHYKNTPDDVQLLADNPSHHLFVLTTGLPSSGKTTMPCIHTVLQICFEGGISGEKAKSILRRGSKPSGDLVPWALASHYINAQLAELKSVRIVRIATHPNYQSFGYGSRAISLLSEYFKGNFRLLGQDIDCNEEDEALLSHLSQRKPEKIDYIGVSFGISQRLFKFWRKMSFYPVNLSTVTNKTTGEYNCIMVHPMVYAEDESKSVPEWFKPIGEEFVNRFSCQLAGPFRNMETELAVNIVDCYKTFFNHPEIHWAELKWIIGNADLKRIDSYLQNISERSVIEDLIPTLAKLFFKRKLSSIHLTMAQARLFIGNGLQYRTVDTISKEMDYPITSILGQFKNGISRFYKCIAEKRDSFMRASIVGKEEDNKIVPVNLIEAMSTPDPVKIDIKLPYETNLSQYAIKDDDEEWKEVLESKEIAPLVTIKSGVKRPMQMSDAALEKELAAPPPKKKTKGQKRKK